MHVCVGLSVVCACARPLHIFFLLTQQYNNNNKWIVRYMTAHTHIQVIRPSPVAGSNRTTAAPLITYFLAFTLFTTAWIRSEKLKKQAMNYKVNMNTLYAVISSKAHMSKAEQCWKTKWKSTTSSVIRLSWLSSTRHWILTLKSMTYYMCPLLLDAATVAPAPADVRVCWHTDFHLQHLQQYLQHIYIFSLFIFRLSPPSPTHQPTFHSLLRWLT